MDSIRDAAEQPWPVMDVIAKLAEAAEILLHRLSYDGHGCEEIIVCVERAKELIAVRRREEEGMDSIDRRLSDAKLGSSIDDAVHQLPEGCLVDVEITCDGVRVSVWEQGHGKVHSGTTYPLEYLQWPVADQIRHCVQWAVAACGDADGGD